VILIEMIKKGNLKKVLLILVFSLYGIRTILRNYDWNDPEKFYLKSLKYSFYPSLLYGNLSYHYFRDGRYEKSLSISQKAISLGLKNETILYVYGLSLSKLGKYDLAIKVFNEILQNNPENYEVLTELGEIYFLKGNFDIAEKLLEKSLEINLLYPKTYYVLIEINKLRGNKEKMINYIQKLTYLVSNDFYLYYLKGLYYKETGNYQNALKEFNKAYLILKKRNDFYSMFNLGILLKEMGLIDRALNLFLKLNEKNPDNVEIMNEIGICYALKGEKAKAKEFWEKVLKRNPNYYPAKENLKKLKF
ncbi:MAG: tetratricopeptide repeat protein, partial [Candidatus Omnitrophica bacterium]|nr:tetratricopeptide repeat protein [Candidatus Omnitrophota bacterium]